MITANKAVFPSFTEGNTAFLFSNDLFEFNSTLGLSLLKVVHSRGSERKLEEERKCPFLKLRIPPNPIQTMTYCIAHFLKI